LSAGFILFLIALPLSVGISIASGAPPVAGILAAVVGGILGSMVGSGNVSINGPAAGLIVVVLTSIQVLGKGDAVEGFKLTLAAIVLAGAMQIAMGLFRLGAVALAAPTSVIHGMLTAIGVIIMAKQVHVVLGVQPTAKEPLGLIAEIPHSIMHLNPEIAIVGLGSMAILLLFSRLAKVVPVLKKIPAPLAAVTFGVILGLIFDFDHPHAVHLGFFDEFQVGPKALLNVPMQVRDAISTPDWAGIFSGDVIRMAITIALVASIESVLSALAVDHLDPQRRQTDLNRELWSKGICNLVLGLIGGLPIISEIVRSKANVENGAQTKWANFIHGVLILAFVGFFPGLLREIPLAALGAILTVIGFRLGHPSQLIHMWEVGWDQAVAFLTTLIVTLASDLLIGVATGFVVELVLHMVRGVSPVALFPRKPSKDIQGGNTRLSFKQAVTSLSFAGMKAELDGLVGTVGVHLDFSQAPVVDHTTLEYIERYREEASRKGKDFHVQFSDSHRGVSRHPLSSRFNRNRKNA
jgi:MFS superfamily sulfate permease-like transporter